jgi:hypothetical protein
MPAAFLMQQMEWREALDEARTQADVQALDDGVERRAQPAGRPGALPGRAPGCARRGPAGAGADVRAPLPQDIDRRSTPSSTDPPACRPDKNNTLPHGPAADLRTRAIARPAPAAHRRRHRPGHHPFAGRRVRHGVAECLPDAQGRLLLPSVVRYLDGGGRQIGEARASTRPTTPRTRMVSVKRFMGRRLADIAGPGEAAVPLRRPARHGGHRHARRHQDAGRGVGRDPGHAAPTGRGQLRRRPVRRRDHRAGLLRRRAAPGHQGRG